MSAIAAARFPRRLDWGLPLGVALAALAAAGFTWLLVRAQALPQGVVPIAWDKEACAHCRMHVGERGFAAQLQLEDGQVLNFDDPGCLFSWLAAGPVKVHATFFHHHTEERWLPLERTGFIAVLPTPMGFGLAAVDASAPGALTAEQAQAKVRVKNGGAK